MFQSTDRIRRNQRPLFSRNRTTPSRMYLLGILTGLIVLIPLLTIWRYDELQLVALEAIDRAPTATPFASARAQQAVSLYQAGDVEGALVFWEQAAKQQPDNPTYLYEYGMLLVDMERYEEASQLGDRVIEMVPDDPRGYALKASSLMWTNPTEAIPIAINGIELGQPYAPLRSALAIAYNNISRYQEALQNGELAIRIDPMNANARRAYFYPLVFTGRFTEAIAQMQQAIAINPNLTGPYLELALLYRRIDDQEMAIGIYERLLEFNPTDAKAYLRICQTYIEVGLFQEGEPYCLQALDLQPTDTALYADIFATLGQLQYTRRNYEGAIDSFNECIGLGSEDIRCYYLRGWSHYLLGECDAAWAILNEALLLDPPEQIKNDILTGLTNVTIRCAGYQGATLPTPIPPTPVPPTPIGGF